MAVHSHSHRPALEATASSATQDGVRPLIRSVRHHSATTAQKAGSAITSHDSQDVRHIAGARQARSGWPRCRKDAPSPSTSIGNLHSSAVPTKAGSSGMPVSNSRAGITTRPCAAPATVVKTITDQAGFIASAFHRAGDPARQVLGGGLRVPLGCRRRSPARAA